MDKRKSVFSVSSVKRLMNNSLLKHAFIYMITTSINRVAPFLLLPIVTYYLTPSDYGIVSTFTAYVSILALFVHINMQGAVNINYFRIAKKELQVYIANTFILLSFTALFSVLIILFFADTLSLHLKLPQEWLFVGLILVVLQYFMQLNLILWQAEQRPKWFGLYQVLQTLFNSALILALVVGLNMGWRGHLIGQALTIILFAFFSMALLQKRKYIQYRLNSRYIKDILKFGIPLIPHSLSFWLRAGADRILITAIVGSSMTGIYMVGYQFGMIVGLLTTAFNQAFSPYLYRKLSSIAYDEKKKLVQITYLYFAAVLILALTIAWISPWVITHIFHQKYFQSQKYVAWIAFAFAFQGMYMMVVNYIFYEKKTYLLSMITFAIGLLHILASYILIQYYGAIGAAYASLFSSIILFLTVWWYSAQVYSMPWVYWRKKNDSI